MSASPILNAVTGAAATVSSGVGGLVGGLGGIVAGKAANKFMNPEAPTPGATPQVANPNNSADEIQAAMDKARKGAGQGSAADILTGGAGLGTQPKVSSNVLLGS